ncbi:LCP family protein [Streptomyces odontomachi]|uniref:LCP family protein n=1 Tax=Streptomyces odontomachi TaxID=2944940 RepID=UPI00210DCEE4|nr:LCP family protein [Streptomyces sp. ODS25]
MRQSGVRGEGAPDGIATPHAPGARDLGWDDGLYADGAGGTDADAHAEGGARADDDGREHPPAEGARATGDDAQDSGAVGPDDGRRAATKLREAAGKPERGGRARARKPSLARRILRWFATLLALAVLGAAGAGYLYYRHLNNNIRTDPLNIGEHKAPEPTPNAAGQTPLNILLIGSDARDSKENQQLGGARNTFGGAARADVQMLVHLSADRTNMSVVSIPRDTLVTIPQCTDPDSGKVYPAITTPTMVNDSLGRGGPGCTVATWEQLTGIHIDHFMMVDFAGVVSMADAIGGVPVCVDANIYSHTSDGHGSGLKLTRGTHSVKGVQALQWLRTRYGFEDGSDIGRTKAQHMYMNSMVRELRKNATLSSPGKLRSIAEEATKALRVDEGLDTVKKLYDLSTELKKPESDRITATTMPYEYVGARVRPKPDDADQLFRLVREDIPLDGKAAKDKTGASKEPREPDVSRDPAAPDAQIAVQVQNGTRTATLAPSQGRANGVAQALVGKGFSHAVADSSVLLTQPRTVIHYPSADLEGDAQRVAKALGIPLTSVTRSTGVSGITLIVGSDWRTGTSYPAGGAGASGGADDDKTPDSAEAINGADDSQCMHVNPAYTW